MFSNFVTKEQKKKKHKLRRFTSIHTSNKIHADCIHLRGVFKDCLVQNCSRGNELIELVPQASGFARSKP